MLKSILALPERSISICDVGAAFFGEQAPYQPLIELGLSHLYAFDPDEREFGASSKHLEGTATLFPYALGDGGEYILYVCPKGLGMSSLLEPDPSNLGFFNCFPEWGQVVETRKITTHRLDDLGEIPAIDFLKMDVQGSELSILVHGRSKLEKCVAVQTEVSFITLYKQQPVFGDIDQEMRKQGFIPHRFTNVKNWAIAPTVRDGEPRMPFHQLLEADIVYIRNIVRPDSMDDEQIKKLAAIAHFVYGSPDLTVRCLLELQRRATAGPNAVVSYLEWLANGAVA